MPIALPASVIAFPVRRAAARPGTRANGVRSADGAVSEWDARIAFSGKTGALAARRSGVVMADLSGSRILVVEDQPLIGMILQACLEENSAEVRWSRTDEGAYEILERDAARLDLLITDINLREGTTGFDVARRARTLNAAIGVIYLSGEVGSDLPFGVDGALFLTKPVPEKRVIEAAKAVIETRPTLLIAKPGLI